MKSLIIAEKPSVARDMAKVLGNFKTSNAYLESDRYIISWAVGHLVELGEPDDYDPKYKTWQLQTLPIIPAQFKLKPTKSTYKQFKVIKDLLHRRDVKEVINACDAGREGELIFRYLYQEAQGTQPIKRLWISSLTDEAIKDGFARLKDGQEYELLAQAARCRSESDWLVGINATRAYTKKCNVLLSIGRVQTPTLAILVKREKEIEEFIPQPYWQVVGTFTADSGKYQGTWFKGKDDRFDSEAAAREVVQRVQGLPGTVEKLETKQQKQQPPLLFDLTELQREMNRKHGLSASKTLQLAQSLYEEVKLITYPRTDSRYISKDMVKTLPGVLRKVGVGPYQPFVGQIVQQAKLPLNPKVVNDKKVTDHHAIIPTAKTPNLAGLSKDQLRVYDAVVRRFLANFYPEAIVEHTTVTTGVNQDKFRTKTKVVKKPGWREVYENQAEEDEATDFPNLAQGIQVHTTKVELQAKETKPPNRYTEASLLSAMETAGKLIDDEELREAMKDGGLGTPATRAGIIERLIKVGYIDRVKKNLIPTEKGRKLIEVIGTPELVSPELTGAWEKQLMEIQQGHVSREKFMQEIRQFVQRLVQQVKTMSAVVIPGEGSGHAKSSKHRTKTEAKASAKAKTKASAQKGTEPAPKTAHQEPQLGAPIGTCPRCGQKVIAGHRGFGCSAFKAGCTLVIPKEIGGNKLNLQQINSLLTNGQTEVISGFIDEAGIKYNAKLVLKGTKVELQRQ